MAILVDVAQRIGERVAGGLRVRDPATLIFQQREEQARINRVVLCDGKYEIAARQAALIREAGVVREIATLLL